MSWFSELFHGGKNPANAAMPFYNQIPGQVKGYYDPYINAGQNALPGLQNQYNDLLNNPGGKLNDIGQNYQQSPGFKFAMEQALQGAGHAAAAGGMAGSPQHSQQAMQLANNIANQDYYNWLGQATGMYNQGLSGQQNMSNQGLAAGGSMADQIAQMLAQQGNLAYQGQQQQNQNKSDLWGNLGALGGAVGGYAMGGPFGAYAGSKMFGGGH